MPDNSNELEGPKEEYSWDWQGPGGTLTELSSGRTIWLQGEEGDRFDLEYELCDDITQRNEMAVAYFEVIED